MIETSIRDRVEGALMGPGSAMRWGWGPIGTIILKNFAKTTATGSTIIPTQNRVATMTV